MQAPAAGRRLPTVTARENQISRAIFYVIAVAGENFKERARGEGRNSSKTAAELAIIVFMFPAKLKESRRSARNYLGRTGGIPFVSRSSGQEFKGKRPPVYCCLEQ